MKLTKSILLMTFAGLISSSCTNTEPGDEPNVPYTPIELTSAQTRSISSQNDLGLAMFRNIAEENIDDNFFYSPLSMNVWLAMIANGTSGETLDEITATLGFAPGQEGLNDLNTFYRMILDKLPNVDKKSTFNLANGAFSTESNGAPKGTFLEKIKNGYDADYITSNSQASLQSAVDAWIKKNTKGLISEFPIDKSSVINSLYFEGVWRVPYSLVEESENLTFTNLDGTVSKPAFIEANLGHAADFGDYIVAEDKFGNGHFQFFAVMPKEGVDFNEFVSTFDDARMNEIIDGISESSSSSEIRMPKFTYKTKLSSLNDNLSKVGLTRLSDTLEEDLSTLSADGFDVNNICQFNYFQIDEKGVKIASATGNGLISSHAPNIDIIRPYIIIVRERSTGVILTMGAIRKL